MKTKAKERYDPLMAFDFLLLILFIFSNKSSKVRNGHLWTVRATRSKGRSDQPNLDAATAQRFNRWSRCRVVRDEQMYLLHFGNE